jgi:DNA-binding beta-propeller fold protein YncE
MLNQEQLHMHQSIALSIFAALSFVPAASPAPPPSTGSRHLMLIVSKGLPGITLYNADTDQPICRAFLGISPHEAIFSNDGRYAYVPVYGSSSVGLPGTDEHELHFIRTTDCKDMFTLDTGDYKRPHGIAVGKSGMIYLTAETKKSLIIIDPKERKIIGSIPTDSNTSHTFALSDDEKKLYVSNVQSKTISVLDIPDRKLAQVIPTESENQRMAISPDRKWFATSLGPDHKVAFFRTSDNGLDFTVPVDGVPFVGRFSADGKYLYDAGTEGGNIHAWKIDIAQRKVVATSESLGSATGTLTVNPFNRQIYVSDAKASKISEIDPDSWKVLKVLPADKTPDAILFTAAP